MIYGACEMDVDGGRLFLIANTKALCACSTCGLVWERSALPNGWCRFSTLNLQSGSTRTVTMRHNFASWGHSVCPVCGPGHGVKTAPSRLVSRGVDGLLGWVGSEAGGRPVNLAEVVGVFQVAASMGWFAGTEEDLCFEEVEGVG